MGASFENWMRGLVALIAGVAFLFLVGWGARSLGLTAPRSVALPVEYRAISTVVGLLLLVGVARFVLSQIFD